MFSSVLDFFEEWYGFSGKEHFALNVVVAFATLVIVVVGSVFFSIVA